MATDGLCHWLEGVAFGPVQLATSSESWLGVDDLSNIAGELSAFATASLYSAHVHLPGKFCVLRPDLPLTSGSL